MIESHPTLDCQACGKVLHELTFAEAQEVARRPYDFVVFCYDCKKHAVEPHLRLTHGPPA